MLHADTAGWGRVTDGLRVLSGAAAQQGCRAYVVVFPVFRSLLEYPLEDVHRKVAAAAGQQGLEVIDLLGDYRAVVRATGAGLDIDGMHPNREGHVVAAMALLRELLAREQVLAPNEGLAPLTAGDGQEARWARLLMRG